MTRRVVYSERVSGEMYNDLAVAYDLAVDALVEITTHHYQGEKRIAQEALERLRAHWRGLTGQSTEGSG